MRAMSMIAAGLLGACGFSGQGVDPNVDATGTTDAVDDLTDAPPLAHTGKVKLTFDNTGNERLDEFPVMVKLSADRIDYALVADPANDLAFTSSNGGSSLKFEIEHWDPAGVSTVWVLVPRIDAGSTTDQIFMTYGAAATSSDVDPPAVWTSDYDAVWHMNDPEASPDAIIESRNAHGGIGNGTTRESGAIAGGRAFTGIPGQSRIGFDNTGPFFDNLEQFSLELWIRPAAILELAGETKVLGKSASMNLGRLIPRIFPLPTQFQVDWHFEGGLDATLPVDTPGQQWTYIVYSSDGTTITAYRNGTSASSSAAARLVEDDSVFGIGDSGSDAFLGKIDEVRIARVARTSSWIRAQYRSMTDQFITYTAITP